MESQKQPIHPERNPKTQAAHRRDVLWQITLPLLAGVLLILVAVGAIIFSTLQPVTDVGRWASVSLMWLILPALFFSLLFLAVLAGLVYAISFLLHLIPHYALLVQLFIERVKNKASQLLNLAVEPVLRINSIWAAIRYATERGRKPAHE
jgi:hypothetical protein